jgi:hypothetical protein
VKISGTLIHLIPDDTYRAFTFQWGSPYIMGRAFKQCFDVQKNKVAAFMVGTDLKTGTLFGIMFKPWFHARIAQYGYSGGFRALKSGNEMALVKKKRKWIPFGKDNLGVCHHRIPKMAIHEFYNDDEIDENEYNVPLKPNYPAIDSLAPHRGEMYQCTAAQTHRIKTESLEALKPHFDKWRKANPNAKVKLIFVLPIVSPPLQSNRTLNQRVRRRQSRLIGLGLSSGH